MNFGNRENKEPTRTRKLLLHKNEILKIRSLIDRMKLIIIPLSIYWKNNKIKIEIALAKQLKKFDKREKIKKEEQRKQLKNII